MLPHPSQANTGALVAWIAPLTIAALLFGYLGVLRSCGKQPQTQGSSVPSLEAAAMSSAGELAIDRYLRGLVSVASQASDAGAVEAMAAFERLVRRLEKGWPGFQPATQAAHGPPEWSLLDTSYELLLAANERWPDKGVFKDTLLALKPVSTSTMVLQSWESRVAGLGVMHTLAAERRQCFDGVEVVGIAWTDHGQFWSFSEGGEGSLYEIGAEEPIGKQSFGEGQTIVAGAAGRLVVLHDAARSLTIASAGRVAVTVLGSRPLAARWRAAALSADGEVAIVLVEGGSAYVVTGIGQGDWTTSEVSVDESARAVAAMNSGLGIVVGKDDGTICRVSVAGGGVEWSVKATRGWPEAFSIANASGLAAVGETGVVQVVRLASGAEVRTLEAGLETVNDVAFTPSELLLAAACDDGVVRIWNMQDGKLVHTLRRHTAAVLCVSWSVDGSLLASGDSSGCVITWQVGGKSR